MTSIEPGALGVDRADRRGERGVAVPSVDDRPTVDRHDVALLEHPRAGDPVDDHLVRRRADDRRVAVVAEEVRLGAPPFEHLSADLIELGGRDARPDRGPDAVVHLGHDAARLAHDCDLVRSLAHAHRDHVADGASLAGGVDHGHDPGEHLVGGADAVDHVEDALALVVVGERRGLEVVEVEATRDRLLGVVVALDHLAAAEVARPALLRRHRDGVVGAAVEAHPTARKPCEHDVARDLEIDHDVERSLLDHLVERLRLRRACGGSRRARIHGAGRRDAATARRRCRSSRHRGRAHRRPCSASPLLREACLPSPPRGASPPSRRGARRSGATGEHTAFPCQLPAGRG